MKPKHSKDNGNGNMQSKKKSSYAKANPSAAPPVAVSRPNPSPGPTPSNGRVKGKSQSRGDMKRNDKSKTKTEKEKEDEASKRISRISTPTPQQLEGYRQTFAMYDTDNNGYIDMDELAEMVKKLEGKEPSKKDLKKMMKEVDLNGDGKIDFSEFCYLMTRMYGEDDDPEEEIRRVFDHFDKDHNGSIDRKEVKEMFTQLGLNLGERELDDVMNLMDTDKNGVIDFLEFRSAYIKFSLKSMMDI